MFSRVLALLAVLLLSANTWAAIEINNHQARNMDDVQSLGVIYINHNFATESEARQALNEETDAQGATYYHVILMREPGSNGNMHARRAKTRLNIDTSSTADRYTVSNGLVFVSANNNGHLTPRLPVKAGFLLHRTMLKHELAVRNS